MSSVSVSAPAARRSRQDVPATGAVVIPIDRRRQSAMARHPAGQRRAGRPVPVRPATDRPAPLRLTRRGLLALRVALVLGLVLAVATGVLLLNGSALAGGQSRPVPVHYLTVLPGETLWQIAGEVAPSADRRQTVARIVELNALPSSAVSAGQRLAVPISDASGH